VSCGVGTETALRTIAIINQKGGCGKTTTAINLGAMLAHGGLRVLLVDMDPQSHCAAGLGVPESRIEMDIGDAMLDVGHKEVDLSRLLWRVARQMDLAPSRMRLAGLEAALGGLADQHDRERRLRLVLSTLKREYDVVCIDCPPSIGLLTYNALVAADAVLVPVETSFFSLQGATRQVNTVRSLSKKLGLRVSTWIVPTIHDEENAVAADLLTELRKRFKDHLTPVVIRHDPKLREAASFGQPISDYAPECMGARDYQRLATWVREHVLAMSEGVHEPRSNERPDPTSIGVGGLGEVGKHNTIPAQDEVPRVGEAGPEVKPLSRAEDVARRAQEFLRRVATGRGQSEGASFAAGASAGSPVRADAGSSRRGSESSSAVPAAIPPAHAVCGVAVTGMMVDANLVSSKAQEVAPRSLSPLTIEMETVKAAQRASSGVAPAAAPLLGVRETSQGVLFVQPLSCGHRVFIAGTFNGWSPILHEMRPNAELGVFELCVRLPAGRTRYRLVIDGRWTADPFNSLSEPNPYGEPDSVVDVRGIWSEQPAAQQAQESAT
jgi:cellulose biosynthesis protein BcsQ